jgi:hypothetical protein
MKKPTDESGLAVIDVTDNDDFQLLGRSWLAVSGHAGSGQGGGQPCPAIRGDGLASA